MRTGPTSNCPSMIRQQHCLPCQGIPLVAPWSCSRLLKERGYVMTDRQSWTPLDDAILPLSSRVSFTSAGYVGEVVDWRGQLVWASEPQSDEVAADGLASSQKDAFSAIRRVRAQRGMPQPFSP